ncbi:hypothetical protein JKY72_00425 [Candidatus Gracilibacteria bacterium]|nr:hypothetical protein [Candidatus Gracilibacteria bacterium]
MVDRKTLDEGEEGILPAGEVNVVNEGGPNLDERAETIARLSKYLGGFAAGDDIDFKRRHEIRTQIAQDMRRDSLDVDVSDSVGRVMRNVRLSIADVLDSGLNQGDCIVPARDLEVIDKG